MKSVPTTAAPIPMIDRSAESPRATPAGLAVFGSVTLSFQLFERVAGRPRCSAQPGLLPVPSWMHQRSTCGSRPHEPTLPGSTLTHLLFPQFKRVKLMALFARPSPPSLGRAGEEAPLGVAARDERSQRRRRRLRLPRSDASPKPTSSRVRQAPVTPTIKT